MHALTGGKDQTRARGRFPLSVPEKKPSWRSGSIRALAARLAQTPVCGRARQSVLVRKHPIFPGSRSVPGARLGSVQSICKIKGSAPPGRHGGILAVCRSNCCAMDQEPRSLPPWVCLDRWHSTPCASTRPIQQETTNTENMCGWGKVVRLQRFPGSGGMPGGAVVWGRIPSREYRIAPILNGASYAANPLSTPVRAQLPAHFDFLNRRGTMFVPIPGLGVLRATDHSGSHLILELEGKVGALRPEDVLPCGKKAAFAVWHAVLNGEVCYSEEQLEILTRFILKGM